MVIKCTGYLEFEPENVTRKHEDQSSWKKVAMIRTDDDLQPYYYWFLKTRFNLTLNPPLRGTHVTIINDRIAEEDFNNIRSLFDKKKIDFYIDIEPRSNGKHWWLRVYCPDSESIRALGGLTPAPYFNLHLTLGHANEKWSAHSEYILDCCKRFKLISSEPRHSLETHEIYEFK